MKKRCVSKPSSASVSIKPDMRTPRPPACEYGSGPSNDTRPKTAVPCVSDVGFIADYQRDGELPPSAIVGPAQTEIGVRHRINRPVNSVSDPDFRIGERST